MARPKERPEMKRLKLRHTKQFVSLIEAHGKAKNLGRRERIKLGLYDTDAVLLPKHIEQCLGIGSKTGQVWNAYKRGDRAMPRKALERRVEIGVTQKLLPADVARAFLLDVSISTLGANLAAWPTSEPTDFGLEYFSPTYAMQLALVHAGLNYSRSPASWQNRMRALVGEKAVCASSSPP